MNEVELVEKEKMLNDIIRLYQFLMKAEFNPLTERATQEFLKGMALFAEVKGSTKYLSELARKFQHLIRWVKEDL